MWRLMVLVLVLAAGGVKGQFQCRGDYLARTGTLSDCHPAAGRLNGVLGTQLHCAVKSIE